MLLTLAAFSASSLLPPYPFSRTLLFQSLSSDSPKLHFDPPSLVHSPVSFGTRLVRLDPSPFSEDSLCTLVIYILQLQPPLLNNVILITVVLIIGQCFKSVPDFNEELLLVPEIHCAIHFPPYPFSPS